MTTWGIVLAAGAGRRMGMPKALMRDLQGHWLPRAIRTQLDGGVAHVIVTLGAGGESARALLSATESSDTATPRNALGIGRGITHGRITSEPTASVQQTIRPASFTAIDITNWDEGLGASLQGAINYASAHAPTDVHAIIVTTVDTPTLPVEAITRVTIAAANDETLIQATWHGHPGHPVAIGREHWAPLAETLHGDVGGREYLTTHHAQVIECSDTGDGNDVDRPHP